MNLHRVSAAWDTAAGAVHYVIEVRSFEKDRD